MTSEGSTPRVTRFAIVPTILRALLLFSALLPPLLPARAAAAEHPRVHVKGFTRIDAHAALAAGKLVVSGTVTDDTGHPSAKAEVGLGLTRGSLAGGAMPLALASPESCRDGSRPPALDGPQRIVIPADSAGRFCVRLSLPKDRYSAELDVHASGSLDGARLELPLDLSLRPVTLRFDPERPALPLDEDTTDVTVAASTEADGATRAEAGLWLALGDESGTILAGATTDGSGRAHFVVPGARLGQPGRGELRTTFAGSSDLGPSATSIVTERFTGVDLSAPDVSGDRRAAGSPEEGFTIPVAVKARCERSGCVVPPTGAVEARVGDMVVGAAMLDRGEARVLVRFAAPDTPEVALRFRYAPDAPWFRPAGELVIAQPLRPPSPWRALPVVLAGLGAIAWLVMARVPRRVATRAARSRRSDAPRGGARVELVRGEAASQGWRGQVIDADEHVPLASARLSIERRGFQRTEAIGGAISDAQGRFTLEPIESLPGDELVANAPLHAPLRGPLPATGELLVALVLRRRALLDRLVAWARRRGRPFDAHAEPTPAHVRRAAGRDLDVVRWASAVERAAYGGEVVDEQAQAEIDRLAPVEAVDASPRGAGEGPRGGGVRARWRRR